MISKPSYTELEKEIWKQESILSEQILAEEKMMRDAGLYREMFDQAGVSIVIADLSTREVIAYNKKAYAELGYSKGEYKNLHYDDYVLESPEKKKQVMQELAEKGALVYTTRLLKKSGDIMEVLTSATKIQVRDKAYGHIIRIDITGQKNAEQILNESEEKYRSVLDRMDEAYYEVNLRGDFLYINNAAFRQYGYSAEEMIGTSYRDYLTPETAGKVFSYFKDVYTNGDRPGTIEYEIIKKDGSIVDLETSISLMRTDAGDITGFRGIARDITEYKKLESALKESEERYRTMFENAGFAMTLTDMETGKVEACNKKACEDSGYTEEDLIGMASQPFYAGDIETYDDMTQHIDKNGKWVGSARLKTKSGSIKEVILSIVIVTIRGKQYAHSIYADVSEQKRMENIIKESEAKFRSIFETAPDAIFLTAPDDGKILDANPAACAYSGYSHEALLHMDMKDLVLPEHYTSPSELLDNLQRTGRYFYDTLHVTKTGEKVNVEINSRLIEQKGTKVILSIVRDVTQRKKVEQELAKHRAQLETLVQKRTQKLEAAQHELLQQEKLAVLGQLTATVSHELRNPLGVIQSSNYYLTQKLDNLDESLKHYFEQIDDQVSICDGIIGDLLEYTRGDKSDKLSFDISRWLNPLLDEVMALDSITFIRSIQDDLPVVHHDQVKLQRVVINILNNAIQAVQTKKEAFMAAHIPYEPEISVNVYPTVDHIIINVTDNGIGMNQKTLDQAFEPLFTTRAKGTGLGLANVKKIINEHQGSVHLSSDPGKGTTIVIEMPIAEHEKKR